MDPDSSLTLLGHTVQFVSGAPLLALLSPLGLALHLGALVVLLGLSARFSGSEVALFSLAAGDRADLVND
ncbi:MAG: hypothetical protein R3284_10190, partial [Rubricoccaceae bacterium]|nr:hypothetical protein [Rubricoccaceae bacterium]